MSDVQRHMDFLRELEGQALDTIHEWMRYVAHENAPEAMENPCLTWERDEYSLIGHLSDGLHGAVKHHYRFTVSVEKVEYAEEKPEWIPRTWADVRTGDTVRLPGTEHTAHVFGAMGTTHHVHPDSDPYRPVGHKWRSIVVTLGEARTTYHMDPGGAVEILLAPAEVAAIEALGWENRLGLVVDNSSSVS